MTEYSTCGVAAPAEQRRSHAALLGIPLQCHDCWRSKICHSWQALRHLGTDHSGCRRVDRLT